MEKMKLLEQEKADKEKSEKVHILSRFLCFGFYIYFVFSPVWCYV